MKRLIKYLALLLTTHSIIANETPVKPTTIDSIPAPIYYFPATNIYDIRKSLKIKFLENHRCIFFDFHYIGVKHEFFVEYTKWFTRVKDRIVGAYRPTSFDCDNFALLYKSLMSTSIYKNNKNREILVGIISVKQKKAILGIDEGVLHALNIVKTDKGWFVVEPQTGEFISLKDYPNEITRYIF